MTHKKNKVMAYISKANDPNYNEINKKIIINSLSL